VAITSTLVFETSDLDVCQDVAVEIHPAAWEAIALTVSTILAKKKDSASSRGECISYSFSLPKFAYTCAINVKTGRKAELWSCGPSIWAVDLLLLLSVCI
jgi:hypothetical protein